MIADAAELMDIINGHLNNKSPSLDGINVEYIKLTGSQLVSILSILVLSNLVHGYIRKEM